MTKRSMLSKMGASVGALVLAFSATTTVAATPQIPSERVIVQAQPSTGTVGQSGPFDSLWRCMARKAAADWAGAKVSFVCYRSGGQWFYEISGWRR